MDFLKSAKFKEYAALILFGGLVLFVCVNTGEVKKLFSYLVTVSRPFIYAAVIAFILNIFTKICDNVFKKIANKKGESYNPKKHRLFSIIISLVVFLLFVVLTIVLIIPSLKDTISSLIKEAPALWDKLVDWVDSFKVSHPKLEGVITSLETTVNNYVNKLLNSFKGNAGKIASSAFSTIKSAGNVIIYFLLGLLIAFPVVYKKEELVKEIGSILRKTFNEKNYERITYILHMANDKFQIYFKFNFVQAAITGAGTLIFMLVCRMPHALSISLLITVTQLIPIVGAILGTVVGAILVLPDGLFKAILFVVLCILVQQLVEKVINPHLVGKELDLPGFLTFLSIVIGGKQFGLIGLFCAVPVVSIIYDIYRYDLRPKLDIHKNGEKNE